MKLMDAHGAIISFGNEMHAEMAISACENQVIRNRISTGNDNGIPFLRLMSRVNCLRDNWRARMQASRHHVHIQMGKWRK